MNALQTLLEYLETHRDKRRIPAIAKAAEVPRRSVQSILDGKVPSLTRAEEICRALGLEFYIGPPRGEGASAEPRDDRPTPGPAAQPSARAESALAADRFAADMDMPVRGYARCSLFGHLESESEDQEAPAPQGIRAIDPESFYAIARGTSMIPEGIREGDYCLVSPNTPIVPGMRVWLKDRQGRACIKRLVAESAESFSLRGWLQPEAGRQKAYDDEWRVSNLVARGAILAVWRGRPNASKPPALIPDPRRPDLGEQKGQVAPALSPDLARYLGLPEGASVAEAIQAIEARAATTLSRDEVAVMMRAETESLRDEIRSLRQSPTDAAETATRPNPDPDLLERLANVASTMLRDANITLPPASLTAEAVLMFNDLVAHVSDVSDPDEIAAAMPLVKYNLSKRLKDAMDNPGAGKCGA